jgi:hypothetical protein
MKQSDRCRECQRAAWKRERHERFRRLEVLWAEGLPIADIAERFGTTANALGVEMHRARAEGFNLPLRKAHTPREGNLTKRQCREQFTAAIRGGRLRRCTRCEVCGDDEAPIEGHHHNYNRPLYVTWLCPDCHSREHGGTPAVELLGAAA